MSELLSGVFRSLLFVAIFFDFVDMRGNDCRDAERACDLGVMLRQ